MSGDPQRPAALTALVHVADVPRAIAFYERLGFEVGNRLVPRGQFRVEDPEGYVVMVSHT